jgi:hypothetical protein
MSPLEGFLIIAAILAASGAGTVTLVRRARAEAALRDQIPYAPIAAPGIEVWDDNAGCWLTLAPGVQPAECQYTEHEVAVLDALVCAWESDAFDPATDPQWAAGRARLLAALNNDDQQGEQL